MKKYTFTGLLNNLIFFEEELYKILSEKRLQDLAEESIRRREKLKDISSIIIVEMTLEPIYTIDFIIELGNICNYQDPRDVKEAIKKIYGEIKHAIEPVSMEFAELLKSFI